MMTLQELMNKVYTALIESGVAKDFRDMMKLRAEMIARSMPATPSENRPLAEGQILICYELADGAEHALSTSETEAKVKEAERIREMLSNATNNTQTESLE